MNDGLTCAEAPAAGDGRPRKCCIRIQLSLLASPVQSVYNGQVCLGHIVSRGKCGFEAYDTDDISLGIFPDQQTAAAAISRRAAP